MDRRIFMVVFIFAFWVLPYSKVVAETVEVNVYSNASSVIVNILTPGNNKNLTPNHGLKLLQSETNPNVSEENPIIILVPPETVFSEFLSWNENHTEVSGFCIEVFKAALQVMGPDAFPYKFVRFNKTSYNDLIKEIHDNETVCGAVGDITMLAERSKLVDFTAPYMESGIAMVTRVKDETRSVWMVFRPFSKEIWLAMIGTFLYTGLVVWFLEHGENPEFRGPWPKQFGNTVWFIFSTLFFAHRERITSNYSRIVIMVWLFLILVMVSCFTASLSSMLTVRKLTPEVNDVNYLLRHNKQVGCDNDSFISNYLENINKFKNESIVPLKNETEFAQALDAKRIHAAFTEIPYLKVFLERYPDKFKMADRIDRVGGLAFAFRKGFPYTFNISTAILNLTEMNKIADLENSLLYNKSENWNRSTKDREIGLTIDNFWVLFVFSAGTSTVILIIFVIHLVQRFQKQQSDNSRAISRERVDSFRARLLSLVRYWNERKIVFPGPESRSQDMSETKNSAC